MERINERLGHLTKALERLHESLNAFQHTDNGKCVVAFDQVRDSVIKRFEFCADIFWKCLKDHLMNSYGIEVASPKPSLRESLAQKIILEEEYKILIAMIDDRNRTSHCYDEGMAQEIAGRTQCYFEVMSAVMARLKKQQS